MKTLRILLLVLLPAVLAFGFNGAAWADPPSRVARLGYISGAASFSVGGERDWSRAVVNRPLITGDRLWVDRGARAELQLGSAAIRAGGATELALLNLDDRTAQVELTQGILNLRVRRLDRGQVFEIDTPMLAFSIRRPGSYRVQVDAESGATTVLVRSGMAEVYGEGRAFVINDRIAYRFYDPGLRDYQTFARWPTDEFDRWASERDRRWDNSPSRRYLSTEVIGYADLDSYGTWRQVREYGNVWVPHRVAADWAPYRDGHWSWVEPWGWTWIDDAPWGFAPSHYGRWAHIDSGWCWVPGPATARPVYAPALVAFIGSGNLQAPGGSAVAWFPLGPREVYRPSYAASREYFYNVNVSNTVVNRNVVTQYYGNAGPVNATYSNRQVAGAVTAVLAAAFAQAKPVDKERVRIDRDAFARAPVAAVAPVAPVHASVVGAAPAAPSAKPPENARRRPVVAQVAPPPPPVPFSARQRALAANPGKPLDAAAVAALKPAAPASAAAPAVKVVEAAKPVAAPAKPASAPRAARPDAPAAAASAPAAPATGGTADAARPGPAPGAPASPRARGEPPRGRPEAVPRSPQAEPAPQAPPTAPPASAPSARAEQGERQAQQKQAQEAREAQQKQAQQAQQAREAQQKQAQEAREAQQRQAQQKQAQEAREGQQRQAQQAQQAREAQQKQAQEAREAQQRQAQQKQQQETREAQQRQAQQAREAQQKQAQEAREAQQRQAQPAREAQRPAAAPPAPPQAGGEQRGRGRPDNAGAPGRREGASDAKRGGPPGRER